MSNVIGPINAADWWTMREIRKTVGWLKSLNDPKYQRSIDMEWNMYTELKDSYVKAA